MQQNNSSIMFKGNIVVEGSDSSPIERYSTGYITSVCEDMISLPSGLIDFKNSIFYIVFRVRFIFPLICLIFHLLPPAIGFKWLLDVVINKILCIK